MKKDTRIIVAKDTLKILEDGYYENLLGEKINIQTSQQLAEINTRLYTPQTSDDLLTNLPPSSNFQTQFEVSSDTTMNAVRQLIEVGEEDVFYLNFASARNPGGGFLTGAQAQEESIARVTGLYPCQMKTWDYYEANRKTRTCLYTDHLIYSPRVPILKNETGELLESPLFASIVTAPAVNTGVVKRREPENISKIEPIMRGRIAKVLGIAAIHKHEVLVLGAWGCGVFQNNPQEMARWFEEALEGQFKGQFRKIVFAIYSRNERFITPFLERFQ